MVISNMPECRINECKSPEYLKQCGARRGVCYLQPMPRGAHLTTDITDRHRKVARGILLEGKPIRQAMLDAGYSQASANQGMARLKRSAPLAAAYAQELERLKNRPVPPAEVRAQIVRAKLLENVATGKDESVQSLKLLGQDRELNLWQPEVQQGIIVINSPKGMVKDLLNLDE